MKALPLWLIFTICLSSLLPQVAAGDATIQLPTHKDGPWVTIISPETPQTWSFFSIQRKELKWDEKGKTLSANVTFTNRPWRDDDQSQPTDEWYSFPFPGVTLNPSNGLFTAVNKNGQTIPVAQRTDGGIKLLPTSRINLFNYSGRIVMVMLGTTKQSFRADSGSQWVIFNHGAHLQNLIQ